MFSLFRFFMTNFNDFRRIFAWPRFPFVRLDLLFADPHPTSVSHRSFPFKPPFLMALRVRLTMCLNFPGVDAYGWSATPVKCRLIPWTFRNFLRYLHGSMRSCLGSVVSP